MFIVVVVVDDYPQALLSSMMDHYQYCGGLDLLWLRMVYLLFYDIPLGQNTGPAMNISKMNRRVFVGMGSPPPVFWAAWD